MAIIAGSLDALRRRRAGAGARALRVLDRRDCWDRFKCDCREQFDSANGRDRSGGARRHHLFCGKEGRGIGLGNKIKVLRAAVSAARPNHRTSVQRAARFAPDMRSYDLAAAIACAISASARWRS